MQSPQLKSNNINEYKDMNENQMILIYPTLLAHLKHYKLQKHYPEIVNNMINPLFEQAIEDKAGKGIAGWSNRQLIDWVNTLKFIDPFHSQIIDTLEKESIDGDFIMFNDDNEIIKLGFEGKHIILINALKRGWHNAWKFEEICDPETKYKPSDSNNSLDFLPSWIEIDENNTEEIIYGRLTVLGFSVRKYTI